MSKTEKLDIYFKQQKRYFTRRHDYWNSFDPQIYNKHPKYENYTKKQNYRLIKFKIGLFAEKEINIRSSSTVRIIKEKSEIVLSKRNCFEEANIWKDPEGQIWDSQIEEIRNGTSNQVARVKSNYFITNENFLKFKYNKEDSPINEFIVYHPDKFKTLENSDFFQIINKCNDILNSIKIGSRNSKSFLCVLRENKKSDQKLKMKPNISFYSRRRSLNETRYFAKQDFCSYCKSLGIY